MKIGEKGISLIKSWEKLELKAYVCDAGVLTIGYGHTKNVKRGMVITEPEAERLLAEDLAIFVEAVNSHNLAVNQNQFDALVSFAFNTGARALASSTLLRKVKANPNDKTIRDAFMLWVKVKTGKKDKNGKPIYRTSNGLVNRRKAEADLYFS